MKQGKIDFVNEEGKTLSARLDLPLFTHPIAYAVFAHCFTCNKNLTAVRNISRALTQEGIAVLRFDFTGLGESEGDFTDTDFSSNVSDLVSAARFLEENYSSPQILIGHSLGGAAVIFAASKISSVKAVATIGAPCDPEHVTNLIKNSVEEIESLGKAEVELAGRKFTIKKKFLDDLRDKELTKVVAGLKAAFLIMHSPQDETVGIENAAEIYLAAKHPKSFVTLDGADHLLSDRQDSLYAGSMIAAWAMRYIEIPSEAGSLSTDKQVVGRIGEEHYTTEILAEGHSLIADEPESAGGNDFGPSPYALLSSSLAACTAMTLRMYADRKKWDLKEVKVHIQHGKDYARDCEDCEEKPGGKIDIFEREIELEGNLDNEQRARLIEIADKCPVHKTLHSEVNIKTFLKKPK